MKLKVIVLPFQMWFRYEKVFLDGTVDSERLVSNISYISWSEQVIS